MSSPAPLLLLFCLALCPLGASAAGASIVVYPTEVIQGEPVLVTLAGVSGTSSVKRLVFDGAPLGVFMYRGAVAALIGVDLYKKPGVYRVSAALSNGTTLTADMQVGERPRVVAPLGIPAKLGGNTAQSQKALVTTLASENASLARLRTGQKSFWTAAFRWPLASSTVTDPYGYARETGAYTIAHKGTDLKAREGTPVAAINRGVVREARTYRDYGKTVVVDHGLGLMSFYMHLSKIYVNAGELVLPGQVVGLSGQTGYAEVPHLHLTVRINGISIDPVKFFALFQ